MAIEKPTVFKPLGAHIIRQGVELVVIPRPLGLQPRQACSGCHFCDYCNTRMQCSSFDRQDHISVWFVQSSLTK